ncbi:MAG: tetratricopeptide repeat protein [Rhodospirillales bacterium]|nr:tetratricopeptide repeat protein [Rhodospirillales bacterium]
MSSGLHRRHAGGALTLAAGMLLSLALVLASTTTRADMQAGWQAYTAGDYDAAIGEWQPLAEAGDYQAAYALGMAYQIKGEPAQAVPWYEQAASAGLTEAQILLGTLYTQGSDVPRDLVRAYAWLYKAAEKKGPTAHINNETDAGMMTPEESEPAKALSATL